MWPFNRKKKLTSEQFALVLLELIRRRSRGFLGELQSIAENNWPDFNSEEIIVLANHAMISYLWMASRLFAADRKALDALHHNHLLAYYNTGGTKEEKGKIANAAQAELFGKYAVYYKAWPDMNPSFAKQYCSAVSFEMAQSFFPRRKPVLDARLQVMIPVEIAGFFELATALRKTLDVVDA